MASVASGETVRSPRGWAGLAFLGVIVYGASKLMESYPDQASRLMRVSTSTLGTYLPIAAIAGTILLFAGLVAALWRVNRAAGWTAAGAAGATLGTLGVVVLLGEALALVVGQLALRVALPAAWVDSVALEDLAGTFLAFAGLVGLGWGLTHAGGLYTTRRTVIGPYRGSYERTYEGQD